MDLEFPEIVEAYFSCRKGKRNTVYALDFEFELEKNLFELFEEISSGEYRIGRSIAFVVEQPKIREIWSATFRDRIIHHLIYNRLRDRFLPSFIRDSFACIPGRGTLDGSDRLSQGLRSVTGNWKNEAYYLGADVRNFFVSVDKATLFQILEPRIVEPWLRTLVHQVLFHDPRLNCVLKSSKAAFSRVPGHKSLWKTPIARGLPIGNLTSQFFANIYMNELDQFAKHTLGVKHYYRYVDDLVLLSPDPAQLNDWFEKLDGFLGESLRLEFHPFKKRIGLAHQGVDFVGYLHKPHRRYIRTRTLNKMKSEVNQWRKNPKLYNSKALYDLRASMNSYLGLVKWGATYKFRKRLLAKVDSVFIYGDAECTKLIIPGPRYKKNKARIYEFI